MTIFGEDYSLLSSSLRSLLYFSTQDEIRLKGLGKPRSEQKILI
jgi:hypothetical protein